MDTGHVIWLRHAVVLAAMVAKLFSRLNNGVIRAYDELGEVL
jgi:hypothetical protein